MSQRNAGHGLFHRFLSMRLILTQNFLLGCMLQPVKSCCFQLQIAFAMPYRQFHGFLNHEKGFTGFTLGHI